MGVRGGETADICKNRVVETDRNDIIRQVNVGQDQKTVWSARDGTGDDTQAGFFTAVSYFTVVFMAKERNSVQMLLLILFLSIFQI